MKTKNNLNNDDNDIPNELEFDFSKAKPNKFAKDYEKSIIRVYNGDKIVSEKKPILIDSDLMKFFKNSNQINIALRSLMHAKKRIYS